MCEGGHAALAGWPSLEFGVLGDEGDMTEADRKADVCWLLVVVVVVVVGGSTWSPGRQELHHVGCHVMVVAARGESLSDPRKERVRSHPVPRFWGTYTTG